MDDQSLSHVISGHGEAIHHMDMPSPGKLFTDRYQSLQAILLYIPPQDLLSS